MKKRLLGILICGIMILVITGCEDKDNELFKSNELFLLGHTLNDGRQINFTFNVPYYDSYLHDALIDDEITIDSFISKLEFVSDMNDGGSKLYKYNRSEEVFGKKNFYVLVCNSYDGIKDIFVAKNTNSLANKCIIKIDDLEGVSMTIKEGTLTKEGATVIIKDISSRNNIYGESYRIDKFVDNEWKAVDTIIDNYAWTSKGYTVGGDNKLELEINWKWLYGELDSGKYRIVKDTSESGEATSHYITAEFEID